MLAATTILLAVSATAATSNTSLQSQLDAIVQTHADYWNTSLSMAFGFDNDNAAPTVFAAAAGTNDRFGKGTPITTQSRIPSGSTAKAFTSAAILRYVDLGLIHLDSPAYTYIDPWGAQQNPPMAPLLQQWNGDATINTVTVRQLLSMRSGVKDYKDDTLFQWTLANPNSDFLPEQFLSTVDKSFAFQPGKGGLYSGTGYVMLGLILSAVQNASSWDQVDQKTPLESGGEAGGWKLTLDNTQFMMKGKCNQYPEVTHQYIYGNAPYASKLDLELLATPTTCGGSNYPGTCLLGTAASSFASASADACCSAISQKGGAGVYWEYDGTNCTAFSSVYKGNKKTGCTAGQTDGPFDPTQVQDLYDFSCLNGFTMGNIATTPTDVVLFYSALANGHILSNATLAEMRTYQPLTNGYQPPPGTEYGLGLLKETLRFPLESGSAACTKYSEFCKCIFGFACKTNFHVWGHPGLDWASGMPFLGVAPALNMTYSMGFDSYGGFNSSLSYLTNKETYEYAQTQCLGMDAAVHHVFPDFPKFQCDQW